MKLSQAKNIHFIGIGGIGCSSLAQVLFYKGKKISGSDNIKSALTDHIKKIGIHFSLGHEKENIKKGIDLVIYSPAIPLDNSELLEAKKLKITCLTYPEALGELTKDYFTIAVSGSHGKSTTTAMISRLLMEAGLDPTVVIGTKMKELKNENFRVGKSKYLVIEACEYKRSFLHFLPKILVITNIELDHMDYYKNLSDYKMAFSDIVKKVSKNGLVIANADNKNTTDILNGIKTKSVTLGIANKKVDFILKGHFLSVNKKNEQELKITPRIPGKFNITNGAMAAIVGLKLKIPNKKIEQAIKGYHGSWRRMEYKKKMGKTIVIDDYGHHPTEIKATLSAIRETYPNKKILCVFQPHQYNRTLMLLKDFAKSFKAVNKVIIPNIYKVRDCEADIKKVSPEILVREINKHSKNASYGNGLEKTAEYIKKNHSKFDVIVTMGAGNIDGIYKML